MGRKDVNKRYYDKNREACLSRTKAWWKTEKGRKSASAYTRKVRIKTEYGLTVEEYEARLQAQNNLCALCGKPFQMTPKWGRFSPALDHNHQTGKLRKFLHNKCNRGLGYFDDNPELIKKAVEYLERENG